MLGGSVYESLRYHRKRRPPFRSWRSAAVAAVEAECRDPVSRAAISIRERAPAPAPSPNRATKRRQRGPYGSAGTTYRESEVGSAMLPRVARRDLGERRLGASAIRGPFRCGGLGIPASRQSDAGQVSSGNDGRGRCATGLRQRRLSGCLLRQWRGACSRRRRHQGGPVATGFFRPALPQLGRSLIPGRDRASGRFGGGQDDLRHGRCHRGLRWRRIRRSVRDRLRRHHSLPQSRRRNIRGPHGRGWRFGRGMDGERGLLRCRFRWRPRPLRDTVSRLEFRDAHRLRRAHSRLLLAATLSANH